MILGILQYIERGHLCVGVEVAIGKVRRYNGLVLIELQQNLIGAAGVSVRSEMYKLIDCIRNREELP
jgi:hypothetical protein